MAPSKQDFVVVGEVLKPHGVRGEIRVASHADSPFLFDEVPCVFLRPGRGAGAPAPEPGPRGRGAARGRKAAPAGPRQVKILSWREHKDLVLMTLEGVTDRDAADALRGHEILVRESDLPELGEDEIYLHEIQGLTVLLEDGSRLGVVSEVMLPGGQEVWSITTDDGREVLFPVAEEFIAAVDGDAATVTIAPPPGLLELYLEDGAEK